MLNTIFKGIEAQFVFFSHFNLSAISFIKEITVSYKFPRITFWFVLCFSSHSRISLHGDVTLISKGLQIFIGTQHSACHTLFDTWHPFIWSSPRTLDARTCFRVFSSGVVTAIFNDIRLSLLGFEQSPFACNYAIYVATQ